MYYYISPEYLYIMCMHTRPTPPPPQHTQTERDTCFFSSLLETDCMEDPHHQSRTTGLNPKCRHAQSPTLEWDRSLTSAAQPAPSARLHMKRGCRHDSAHVCPQILHCFPKFSESSPCCLTSHYSSHHRVKQFVGRNWLKSVITISFLFFHISHLSLRSLSA